MATPKVVRHDTRKITRETPDLQAHEELAVEEPLELRVNHEPVTVLMRTPGDDFDLVAGYLFGEGVVHASKDIAALRYVSNDHKGDERNIVDATLGEHVRIDSAKLRQRQAASSSPTGRWSIDQIRSRAKPISTKVKLKLDVFYQLVAALQKAQTVFDRAAGLHAAGIFDLKGTLIDLREDIEQHHAVDKLIGSMFVTDKIPLDHHLLMVSGRPSFGIVQKALAARIPIVAAVQQPTSLAVQVAQSMGQTLVGCVRQDEFNVYAHA